VPEQSVAQTLQKGYLKGSRVIRPAMVVVATGGRPALEAEGESETATAATAKGESETAADGETAVEGETGA
ncbi:MAG: nucleotide exchange factor GrpE, partial [Actinomycetes bacterium]|nr:nucleotide exchange factor GrpE [Actinomycetes bacterium]